LQLPAGLQGLHSAWSPQIQKCIHGAPLMDFHSPSECGPGVERPQFIRSTPKHRPPTAPRLRFEPLQRFPAMGSGFKVRRLASPTRQRLQVFATSWRFTAQCLATTISGHIRSWGSPFRASLLPRSRTPSPTPMPSGRSKRKADTLTTGTKTPPKSRSQKDTSTNLNRRESTDRAPRLQGFAPRESPRPQPAG
jgi:hypothetical protein